MGIFFFPQVFIKGLQGGGKTSYLWGKGAAILSQARTLTKSLYRREEKLSLITHEGVWSLLGAHTALINLYRNRTHPVELGPCIH